MQRIPPSSAHRSAAQHGGRVGASKPGRQLGDNEFAALVLACRASGGLARGDELAQRLQEGGGGDFTSLARQIVSGQVLSFRWRDDFWVPLFQFQGPGLLLRPASAGVREALEQALRRASR